jgi:hypothetical protein
MAVRVKLLKQVLSLAKQGCSDQVCIQAILESCKSYDAPDTIAAFFAEQRKYLLHRYDMLEAEYMGHLEVCGRYNKKGDQE